MLATAITLLRFTLVLRSETGILDLLVSFVSSLRLPQHSRGEPLR